MKILGISGSPRDEKTSGTYKLVETICKSAEYDYEIICLRGKNITGCIACLGCVKDNVCVVKDDMAAFRDKLIQADAYVIGAPNYYSGPNANTQALLERLFQFRHRECDLLWGKLAVAVGVGGGGGDEVADKIEMFMNYNLIETVAKVAAQGAASCFSCGYGEECKVGIPIMVFGEGVKITEHIIPKVEKSPDTMLEAENAGKLLAQRLKNHDPKAVAEKMQKNLMEKFKEGV